MSFFVNLLMYVLSALGTLKLECFVVALVTAPSAWPPVGVLVDGGGDSPAASKIRRPISKQTKIKCWRTNKIWFSIWRSINRYEESLL